MFDARSRPLRALGALTLLIILTTFFSCASSDDLKGAADAANRAAGGGADTATGSKTIDLVAGVSQTGDIQNEAWKVSAQRNVSNTAAGDQYTAVTLASGGGQDALQKAIATDPVVRLIQAEIVALSEAEAEQRPVERLDKLRAELAARLKEVNEAFARSTTPAHVHDVYQIVVAPSALGRDQPGITAEDTAAAKAIAESIRAAKEKAAEPTPETSAPPDSRPSQ